MTSPLDQALRARPGRPGRDLINPPKPLKVSADDHELTVRGAALEKHSICAVARQALREAREFRERANSLLVTKRDTREIARAAVQHVEAVTRRFDSVVPQLQKLREHQEKEISKTLTPTAEDPVAGEIRAYFRASKSPFEEASKLLADGDLQTTRALLGCPPFLAGLNKNQQDTLRVQARAKWCAGAHQLSADLDRAIAQVTRVGTEFATETGAALREWDGTMGDATAIATAFGGADG